MFLRLQSCVYMGMEFYQTLVVWWRWANIFVQSIQDLLLLSSSLSPPIPHSNLSTTQLQINYSVHNDNSTYYLWRVGLCTTTTFKVRLTENLKQGYHFQNLTWSILNKSRDELGTKSEFKTTRNKFWSLELYHCAMNWVC